MIYTDLTKKAMKLSYEAHKDQLDKSGLPYVFHPFHLAEQMADELSCAAALLHDVAEDTAYTIKDLKDMGFPDEVCEALKLLTHMEGIPYLDYVYNIRDSGNRIAIAVKLADLRHNSDLTRLSESERNMEKNLKRVEKYKKAINILSDRSN